ncbi:hypothetical protein Rhopal_002362-T1 [Rhodotorula paludigena]|uniref:Acid phosphatase n=1 Tax=Rhodotorula paludigena TaxID=86838 RepID=A0AAV5GJ57_9BASI|nr:hypothetical protein Rhopal_002362-T1 [Rhodotorula paludigena]
MLSAVAVASLALLAGSAPAPASAAAVNAAAIKNPLPSYISNNLGPYSPWYPLGSYRAPPSGCKIDQVNILQRHGARFPTANAGKKIQASIAKLQQNATSLTGDLEFVKDFTYSLKADVLTPLGKQESYEAGVEAYKRYSGLLGGDAEPTASLPSLVIDNTAGMNNTLDDNNCDDAPENEQYADAWLATYAVEATTRINEMAPNASVEVDDILNYMQLCGFESEYKEQVSPWCKLFTSEEFAGMEYYYDLSKYYKTGYGNALGPAQGVGYINELISRLTGDRAYVLADETQVNQTLAQNPSTFPLDRALYADFSHDNQMIAIFSAMGLSNGPSLPETGPHAGQVWVTSQLVPFAGRLVTERLTCGDETFIRFFMLYALNNADGDYLECGWKAV